MRKEDKRLIIENNEIYLHYKERLVNLALSQFEWHGLPDTCDRLYFEKRLLYGGKAAMYVPKGTDFWLSTDYIQKSNGLSVYGYPRAIKGVGYGKHNLIATEPDKWEILFDNMTMTSLMPKIDLYARLLWEVHNTYRSNLQQQVTPYIILTEKTQELSFRNFFNRVLGFQPVVAMKSSFDPEQIQTLDTRVNFIGKELLENLKIVWAEALAILGITAETTKKERMLDDELTLNRMEDDICLNSRLLNRMEFCNKMNDRYGMNLSVNVSSRIEELSRLQAEAVPNLMTMVHTTSNETVEPKQTPERKEDKE